MLGREHLEGRFCVRATSLGAFKFIWRKLARMCFSRSGALARDITFGQRMERIIDCSTNEETIVMRNDSLPVGLVFPVVGFVTYREQPPTRMSAVYGPACPSSSPWNGVVSRDDQHLVHCRRHYSLI